MINLDFLTKYPGKIRVNGECVSRLRVIDYIDNLEGDIEITLYPENFVDLREEKVVQNTKKQYTVFVKAYMLNKSSADFNFMRVWNEDIPMPMRLMKGEILQETRGMYRMKLVGQPMKTTVCSRCGKFLVNPVSRVVGVGPECASAIGIDISLFNKQQCEQAIRNIEERISKISWEGWIPKTAILTLEEITND